MKKLIDLKDMKDNPQKLKGMMRIIYDNPSREADKDIESLEWLAAHVGRLYQEIAELKEEIKKLRRH